MLSFVLNCVCAQTTVTCLCTSFLCVCAQTASERALSFFSVFVATSPFLMLCPPTQNGAILSPSVPEMKYKPLKCILILPCRLRLKNKRTHACTHTHTNERGIVMPALVVPKTAAACIWQMVVPLLCMPPY